MQLFYSALAGLGLSLILATSALATTSAGYTCSKDPGKQGTCTCSGVLDCNRLKNGGACGPTTVLSCTDSGCSCDWVPKTTTTVRPPKNQTKPIVPGSNAH